MMKKGSVIKTLVILLSLQLLLVGANKKNETKPITLEKVAESGGLFDMGIIEVSKMAVDPAGNIFLLNSSKSKIAKLDRNLKFKTLFGEKGQGPGEFNRGLSLSVDSKGNVYVYDMRTKMIRYSGKGKLIEEVKLSGQYNGFYGYVLDHPVYVMTESQKTMQAIDVLVVDIEKKKILSESELLFPPNFALRSRGGYISLSVPFMGGHIFIDTYDKYCVTGEGERYFVRLFDASGKAVSEIKKDIKPQPLTPGEAVFAADLLSESLPDSTFPRDDIRRLTCLYKLKNVIFDIKLSKNRVYIFTVPGDIRTTKEGYPVEIYDFNGKPVTRGYFPKVPKKIYDNHAYFIETSVEDDEGISRLVKYKIKDLEEGF